MTYRRIRHLVVAGLALTLAYTVLPTGAVAVGPHRAQVKQAVKQAAAKPPPLKPNLVVLKANDVHIDRGRRARWLRFESALGNIGRGPVEVRPNRNRPCPAGRQHATQVMYRDVDGSGAFRRRIDTSVQRRSAGCMVFHPAHDHWHFEAAAKYRLFQPAVGNVEVARRKMSFCLRDSRRLPARYGRYHQPQFYGACSRRSPQGISTGWVDVYQSFLASQSLRLPARARNGLYCLKIRVDPRNLLVESDDTDNTSVRAFSLRGDRVTYRRTNRCT